MVVVLHGCCTVVFQRKSTLWHTCRHWKRKKVTKHGAKIMHSEVVSTVTQKQAFNRHWAFFWGEQTYSQLVYSARINIRRLLFYLMIRSTMDKTGQLMRISSFSFALIRSLVFFIALLRTKTKEKTMAIYTLCFVRTTIYATVFTMPSRAVRVIRFWVTLLSVFCHHWRSFSHRQGNTHIVLLVVSSHESSCAVCWLILP